MAKLTLLLATFALFLLLANATLHATVEIDDENPQRQGQGQGQGKSPSKCRQEFQPHKHLRACQRYIRRRTTPRFEDIFLDEDFEDEIEDSLYEKTPQLLQNCCQQVKQIDPACRCASLRMAARQELQKWKGQGQQVSPQKVQRVLGVSSNIPSMCKIQPQSCPWSPQAMGLEMVTEFEE